MGVGTAAEADGLIRPRASRCLCSSLYRELNPVATAPGSVLVDPRRLTLCQLSEAL